MADAAFLVAFDGLSRQQRGLFEGVTAGALLGAIARVSRTAHYVSYGSTS